jgi:antitoxin component YwqK of YwqJK toxin-antitoxin module
MKKLLTIFCLVLLSSYSYSEEVYESQLVEREGVHYKKFSTTPFTGTSVSFYENGQLKEKGNFKDGQQDSLFTKYTSDGRKELEGRYENGLKEGQWWEGLSQGSYKKGKRDGFWIVGNIVFGMYISDSGFYKEGKKDGEWTRTNTGEKEYWVLGERVK